MSQTHHPPSSAEPSSRQSNFVTRPRWNPYVVGACIGVLSWLVFAIVDKPLGISTSISAASGATVMPLVGQPAVADNPYWASHMPKWDYGMLFLVGTFLGALISALISRDWRIETVPRVWQQTYGHSPIKRLTAAFLGGILVLYGARMAGGCTSGHGISGSLQLAVSSWLFFLVLFISGVITAQLLFRKPRQL